MSAAVSFEAQREREPADRRFRIRALPAGTDWRALLAPSPTVKDRPSGIALRSTAARDLPPEHLAAIDRAVRVVGVKFSPERRWDMRQDLALKLLTYRGKPIANVEAFLIKIARDLVFDAQRDEAYRCRAEDVHATGGKPGYRLGPIRRPTWFPPHEDAEEFAPLACKGARVMQVDSGDYGSGNDREDEMIARIDDQRRARDLKRAPLTKCAGADPNSTGSSLRVKK